MIDIDALLAQGNLELKLGGHVYKINDIPLTAFLDTLNEGSGNPKELHKQLALILNVEEDDEHLKTVGMKACALALQEVRKWLTDVMASEETEANPT